MAFNEEKLEQAIIDLLGEQGNPHKAEAAARAPQEAPLSVDLESYLHKRYTAEGISYDERCAIVRKLDNYSSAGLYNSNKAIMKLVSDGFSLKREAHKKKDLHIQLLDYSSLPEVRRPEDDQLTSIDGVSTIADPTAPYASNIFKFVDQMEIVGTKDYRFEAI